jgi:hypothetical protein
MITCVYDKTDKGREEIATRKYQIPARMRTLLVLVDGHRPLEWLLNSVAGLGLTQHSIDELLSQQFIQLVPGTEPVLAAAPAAETNPASARARMVAKQAARVAAAGHASVDAADDAIDDVIASTAMLAPASTSAPLPDAGDTAEQFREIYAFYNRTIKAAIGLRGVMLQLKVEKAVGVEALRELRTPFLQAVIKAKGGEVATAIRDELDALLGGAPAQDEVLMPEAGAAPRGALDFFNMSGGAVEY